MGGRLAWIVQCPGDPGELMAAPGQGSMGSAWSLTASLPGDVTSLRLLSHL